MSTGWKTGDVQVNEAEIAAAVVLAIDIPTAIENGAAANDVISPQLDAIAVLVEAVGTVDLVAIANAVAAEVNALGSCQAAIDSREASLTGWSQTGAAAAILAAGLPAATATAVGAQVACDAAIAARQTSLTTWAQTGCAAAISAAALATAANLATLQTTCTALPSSANIVTAIAASGAISTQMQDAAAAAITAAGLATASKLAALQTTADTLPADTVTAILASATIPTQIQTASAAAITAAGIPAAVAALAVGATMLHTSVTISGAGTSGTVRSAPAAGLKHYIVGMMAACSVANSTFSLASSGGTTMGAMQLLIGTTLSFCIPFGYIIRGATATSVTGNKTTGATLVIDVWYYTAA